MPVSPTENCYDYPAYWDIAFRDETRLEAEFVAAVVNKYVTGNAARILDVGCGGGRLTVELASRGYNVVSYDLNENCVDYVIKRLSRRHLHADVSIGDMRTFISKPKCDIAVNTVSTFRHLLSEADALAHLDCAAKSVRRGGVYIIGLHLLPPDADLEDEEQWVAKHASTTVSVQMKVVSASRRSRLEVLQFQLDVVSGSKRYELQSEFKMRLYSAKQIRNLLSKSMHWQLVDVYDYWYDIEQPLELNNELGDTVLVLKRR